MRRGQAVYTIVLFQVIVSVVFAAAGSAAEAPRITKEEAKALLGGSGVIILDARTGSSWTDSARKIKGALRVDPSNVDSWAGTIPRDKKIIIYCS